MAKSTRDRVQKHRQLQKERDLQVAIAAARIALGQDPGDGRMALGTFIRKIADRKDVPEEYANLLEEASEKLLRKRHRL